MSSGPVRLLLPALLMLFCGAAVADANWRENGTSRAATEGGQCVRETDWMRRNHMELIRHDRDVVVHQGIRTLDGSLAGCVACHANRAEGGGHVAVTAPEQFCAGCHAFAGVSMDCFGCHRSTPGAANGEHGRAGRVTR